MLWKDLGYTPHQLVLGLSSGVPGIYEMPENDNIHFSGSMKRIKAGINKSHVTQPHSTLGGSFLYETGPFLRTQRLNMPGLYGRHPRW